MLLLGLIYCVASCTVPRDAPSTRTAPFVSADCQYSGLSVPLQQFHLGAQVHFHLRNLHCQQEQEVEPQHIDRTSAPYSDCRADPAGLLQRFHLGAQVPNPPNTLTHPQFQFFWPSILQHKSLHPSHAPLHSLNCSPTTRHRSLACCASVSALLLGPETCDHMARAGCRAARVRGRGLQ